MTITMTAAEQAYHDQFAEACDHMEEGRHTDAMRMFQALSASPHVEPDLHVSLANCYEAQKNYPAALGELSRAWVLEQAKAQHPAHQWEAKGEIVQRQARLFKAMGDLPSAKALFDEAVLRCATGGDCSPYYEAAALAVEMGDYEAAGKHYADACLFSSPWDTDIIVANCTQGIAAGKAGSWTYTGLARGLWTAVRETEGLKNTQDPELKAKLKAVLTASEKAVQLDPKNPYAHRIHAVILSEMGNVLGASAALDTSIALYNDPLAVHFWVELQFALGKTKAIDAAVMPLTGPHAADYYNGPGLLDSEPETKGLADDAYWDAVHRLKLAGYERGMTLYEAYHATGTGARGCGDAHMYSMLCNNYGIRLRAEKSPAAVIKAIEVHHKGLAVSEFYEHWENLRRCYYDQSSYQKLVDTITKLHTDYEEYVDWDDFYFHHTQLSWAYNNLNQPELALKHGWLAYDLFKVFEQKLGVPAAHEKARVAYAFWQLLIAARALKNQPEVQRVFAALIPYMDRLGNYQEEIEGELVVAGLIKKKSWWKLW